MNLNKEQKNYWKLNELQSRISKYNTLYENRGEIKRIDCTETKFLEHGNICPYCGTNKMSFLCNIQERAGDEGTTAVLICENKHKVRIL